MFCVSSPSLSLVKVLIGASQVTKALLMVRSTVLDFVLLLAEG